MFARLSIRAKITAVVAFLLVAMAAMGALNVRQMNAINSSTVDVVSNWLPSVRVLGNLRTTTIDVRNLVRELMLSETPEFPLRPPWTNENAVRSVILRRAKLTSA
jgi:methyl-accepting chemotaxis protein